MLVRISVVASLRQAAGKLRSSGKFLILIARYALAPGFTGMQGLMEKQEPKEEAAKIFFAASFVSDGDAV